MKQTCSIACSSGASPCKRRLRLMVFFAPGLIHTSPLYEYQYPIKIQHQGHVTGNKKEGIGGYPHVNSRPIRTGPQFGREYIRRTIQSSRHSELLTRLSALSREQKKREENHGFTFGTASEYIMANVLSACHICDKVIYLTEMMGRTCCCGRLVHVSCFVKTLREQSLRGVIHEKQYCPLCFSLCQLSPIMSELL